MDNVFLELLARGEIMVCSDGVVHNMTTKKPIGTGVSSGVPRVGFYLRRDERPPEMKALGPTISLYRLMWLAFYGWIPDGYQVVRKDTTKTFPPLEELMLATPKERVRNTILSGRRPKRKIKLPLEPA